jgi:hypothetical protein
MAGSPNDFEIKAGEEFACISFTGMQFSARQLPDPFEAGLGLWVSGNPPVKLDNVWRRWLGQIVSERIEQFSNFVITAHGGSTSDRLQQRALHFLWGICVSTGITQFDTGDVIWGNLAEAQAYQGGVRVGMGLSKVYRTVGVPPPEPTVADLKQAVTFAERLEQIIEDRDQDIATNNNPFTALHLRPISAIAAFQAGAQQTEPAYRLHQFARTVEAFMPASVRGANDFVRYGAMLLKADMRNTDVLKQMYDLRSATEHHRPFDQRALPGVANPNDLAMQRARQAETLAREVLRRFVSGAQDLRQHLKDESSLDNFWANFQQVSQVWGTPLDINAVP